MQYFPYYTSLRFFNWFAFLREAETPKLCDLISPSLLKSSFEAEFVYEPRFDIGFTDWLQQGPSSIGIDENEAPKNDFVESGPARPLSATKGKSHRLPLPLKKGRALVDTTNKKTGYRFSAPVSGGRGTFLQRRG